MRDENLPPLLFGGARIVIGGWLLLAYQWFRGADHVTPGAVAVFLYLLIVGSLAGFVAFNWLLGHVSAAKVGTYAYVNPLVAVLIGWVMGEDFTLALGAGMAIILLGVFLVRGGEKKPEVIRLGSESRSPKALDSANPEAPIDRQAIGCDL